MKSLAKVHFPNIISWRTSKITFISLKRVKGEQLRMEGILGQAPWLLIYWIWRKTVVAQVGHGIFIACCGEGLRKKKVENPSTKPYTTPCSAPGRWHNRYVQSLSCSMGITAVQCAFRYLCLQ
uniref:Uncharacterized protein n=1 Tax=Terrapene triunguis TaxID=2587831 RepID=A0A674JGG3_9SAUR